MLECCDFTFDLARKLGNLELGTGIYQIGITNEMKSQLESRALKVVGSGCAVRGYVRCVVGR